MANCWKQSIYFMLALAGFALAGMTCSGVGSLADLTDAGDADSTGDMTDNEDNDDQDQPDDGNQKRAYEIVDTGQEVCYNNSTEITCPSSGASFYGQDAQYDHNPPQYVDNGDGTVTDLVTGLMWQQGFSLVEWSDASAAAAAAATGGYTDWQVPTIKQLYSLIDFRGNQGTGPPESSTPPADAAPFIDTDDFNFEYPSTNRYIDAQYVSSTEYTSTTMDGSVTFFGVNFADGRIKGYPKFPFDGREYYARFVRLADGYGENQYVDNGDGTISDEATGLTWMQSDSGDSEFADEVADFTYTDGSMNWQEALDFCENLVFAGHANWQLPNAKQLHSILDYSRSPDATNSPAIDSLFDTTAIVNEAGMMDYPFYWTSTTFNPGSDAAYIAFGRGLGYMDLGAGAQFYDVHGAGCQRTDPKIGEPSYGFGPQGDVRRVYNFVRCVAIQ